MKLRSRTNLWTYPHVLNWSTQNPNKEILSSSGRHPPGRTSPILLKGGWLGSKSWRQRRSLARGVEKFFSLKKPIHVCYSKPCAISCLYRLSVKYLPPCMYGGRGTLITTMYRTWHRSDVEWVNQNLLLCTPCRMELIVNGQRDEIGRHWGCYFNYRLPHFFPPWPLPSDKATDCVV